jgi:hypothetical protein
MVQCKFCGEREGNLRCTDCNSKDVYCSEACKIANWPHIFDCYAYRGKTVPSAYHLARSCYSDLIPTDKQTLEDYGFNRAYTPFNQMMLVGLYEGLFKCFEINPETVLTWKREGILIQEIKKVFERIPPQDRGQYYPWFLEHQDLLDPSLEPSTKVMEDFRTEAVMRAWRYIGGRPLPNSTAWNDINIETAAWHRHKQDCFDLCVLLLSGLYPGPSLDIWLWFGFCTTQNQYDEMQLGIAYRTLIMRCTFEEFYQAYGSCSLVQLFSSKNINLEQFGLHLADLLANAPYMNKSVWDLKQFVVADEPNIVPVASVMLHYGFLNCRNKEEEVELKKVYKSVFENSNGDPLKLHQACLRGKIEDYVRATLKLSKRHRRPLFRRLMKNIYPLPRDCNPTISHFAGLSVYLDLKLRPPAGSASVRHLLDLIPFKLVFIVLLLFSILYKSWL